MSLIVWYPFTKDFKNKGLSDITETVNSGVTLVNSNQFGTCASFDGVSGSKILLDNFPGEESFGQTTWSVSFWINFKNDGQRGIILGNYKSGGSEKVAAFEINASGGVTNNSLRLYWYTGSVNYNYQSNLIVDANKWTHVCFTYDGTTVKFYKNGELVDSVTKQLTFSGITNNTYIGGDNRSGNILLGELHDFRIYNHALSTKEIKELSKGLILHHDLKGYGAGENLLQETPVVTNPTEFDNILDRTVYVRDTTDTTESYIHTGRTPQIEKSTKYTFSSWVWVNDYVKGIQFFWLSDTEENQKTGNGYVNVTRTSVLTPTPNQWNYMTWTFTTKSDDYTGYMRYDNEGSKTEGEHAILKVYNPKLEKGSKATPYIPYSFTTGELRTVPSNYTPLEYIESTGTQYINTGYIHKSTTRIDIVCYLNTPNTYDYRALFGARNGTYHNNSFNFFTIFGYNAIPVFSRSGNEARGTGLLYNEKILVSAYDKTCSWYKYGNSTASGSVTTSGTADTGFNTMLLFALNRSTTADGVTPDRPPLEAKIYSCKIWDDNGNTLVRDFVPALRKSDSKIGLYDAVNDTFYTNAGTGEFLTSPDIIEEDLSGNGFNGTRQGVTFTPDSPRYYMSTEFDANKDLLLDRIFHQGDEVSNLSVSILVKFKDDASNPNIWSLNDSNFIRITKMTNKNQIQICPYMNNGTQYFTVDFSETIEQNKWYHLVLTFNNGIFKFYANGLLINTTDKTSVATTLKCLNNTNRWSLGDYIYGSELIGNLSDFRIYAKTLTSDEVKELYQTSALIDKSGKMYCGEFVEE